MRIKGDILITDPCYWMKDEDFNKYCHSDFGLLNPIDNMQGMFTDTIYGDWKCSVYKTEEDITEEMIAHMLEYGESPIGRLMGTFTADAGLVSISEYNETWDYNSKNVEDLVDKFDWTATVLNDFDGEVVFTDIYTKNFDEPMRCIIGKGNYNFYTIQTGF